jgi:hypothetical protein
LGVGVDDHLVIRGVPVVLRLRRVRAAVDFEVPNSAAIWRIGLSCSHHTHAAS